MIKGIPGRHVHRERRPRRTVSAGPRTGACRPSRRRAHRRDCAVRTLDVEGGRITGIVTEAGRIACAQVVLAGGAWSTHLANNAGITLPRTRLRSTVARTEKRPTTSRPVSGHQASPCAGARTAATRSPPAMSPSTISHRLVPLRDEVPQAPEGLSQDVRLHGPEGYPGAWSMRRSWSASDTSPFEEMRVLNSEPDQGSSPSPGRPSRARAGDEGCCNCGGWAGMIDVTPDAVPLIGESHDQPGLYILTGLSGTASALGQALPGHGRHRFRPNRWPRSLPLPHLTLRGRHADRAGPLLSLRPLARAALCGSYCAAAFLATCQWLSWSCVGRPLPCRACPI